MEVTGDLGAAIGALLYGLLFVLALAWLVVPIWVYRIRRDVARHLDEQREVLRVLERMERRGSQRPG